MKFSAIAFAAGAAAAAVQRQEQDLTIIYQVTNFKASCTPHSIKCNYSFDVFQPGTMQTTPQHCSADVVQEELGELPGLEEGLCEQTSKTFKVIKSTDGLALFVSAPVSPISNTTAVHQINKQEVEWVVPQDDKTAFHQVYVGPDAFPMRRPDSE